MIKFRNQDLNYGDFHFKNYVNLTLDEKSMVLEWRNDESIRKWMYDKEVIELQNHLSYIESLKNKTDRAYWLVINSQGEAIGSVSVTDLDEVKNSGEIGYYTKPDIQIPGYAFVDACYHLFFDILDIGRMICTVDNNNKGAKTLDSYFGCAFDKVITVKGNNYCYSNNLTKELFNSKTSYSFSDYVKYVKTCRTNNK